MKVVLEILFQDQRVEVVGLLDRRADRTGQTVLNVPVIGGDERLEELRAGGVTGFFLGVGHVGTAAPRRALYRRGLAAGLEPVSAIHPSAVISTSAVLGRCSTVMALAAVNAGAELAECVIVNTGAVIEHDCRIAAHAHVATGARLAGGVELGEGALIGAGAVVRQGIRIGPDALVGAGAVVVKDVPGGITVVGNPARPLARR